MKPLKVLGRDLRFSNAFDDQPLPDMRKHYRPRRRPTDSNQAEWSAAQRFIPQSMIHSKNRATPVRYLLNATLFRLTNAIPLRALPRDFPPWGSVHAFEEHLKVLGVWPPMLHAMGRDHLIPRLDKLMRDQPESLPLSLSEDDWGPTPVKTEIIGKIHEYGLPRDPTPLENAQAHQLVNTFGIRRAVAASNRTNPDSQQVGVMNAIAPIPSGPGLYATHDPEGNWIFHAGKDLDRAYRDTTNFIELKKLIRDRHQKALDAGAVYAKVHVHPEIRPHLGAIHAETEENPYYDMGKYRDELPYLALHDALIENGFDGHAAELMNVMTTPDPKTGHAGFPPNADYLAAYLLGEENPETSGRDRFSLGTTRILGRTVRFSIDSFGPSPIKVEEDGHVIVHTGPGIQIHANTNEPESIGDREDRHHAMNARDLSSGHARTPFLAQVLSGDPEDNLYAVGYPHIGGVELRRPGIYLYSDNKGNITAHTSRNEYGDLDRDFYRDEAGFDNTLRQAHDYAVKKGKIFQRVSAHPEIEPHIKAVLEAHRDRNDDGKADEAPLLIMSDALDEQGYGDHAGMARDVSKKYGKLPRHWVVGQLAIPDPLRASQDPVQDIEDDVNRFALDPDRPIMSFEPEGKVNRIMLNSSDRAREIASRDILNRNTEEHARNLALKAMRNGKHMASSFLPFNESSGHYNAVYLIADPEGNVTAHHLAADSLLPFDPSTLDENLDKAHNLHRFANFSSDPHFNPTSPDVVKSVVDLHNKALQDNQVFGRYHVQEDFKPHLGAILNAHRDWIKEENEARWRPMELTEDEPQEDEAPKLIAKDFLLDEGHPAYDKIDNLFASQKDGNVPYTSHYLDNLHGDYELDERNQQFSLTKKILGRTVRFAVSEEDDTEPSSKKEAHPMDATKELDALRNRTWDSYTDEERYPHGRGHHEETLDGDSWKINAFEASLKHLKESDPDYPEHEEAFLSALDSVPGATERVIQRNASIAAGPNSNDLPDTRGYLDEFRYLEKHPHVGKGLAPGGTHDHKYLPFVVRDWNEPQSILSFPLPDAERFRKHLMGNEKTRPAQMIKVGLSHGKTDAVPIEGSMVHFTDEKGKLAFPAIVQHVETSKDKNHLFVRPIHDWDSVSDLGNSRIKPLVDAYEHAYLYDNHYPLQPASDNAGAQAMMPAIIQAHRAGQRDLHDFKDGIARYHPNDYGTSFPAAVPHTPDNWDLDRNEASGINGALRAALRSHGSILMAKHGFAQSIAPEDEKLRAKLVLAPLAEKVIESLKANPAKLPEQTALDVVRAEFPHRPNLDEKAELLAYLDRHDMPGAADPKHIQQFDSQSMKRWSPFEMQQNTDQSPKKAAKLALLLENGDQDDISDYIKTVGPFDELKRFAQELIRRDNLAKKLPPDLADIYKKGSDDSYMDPDADLNSAEFKEAEDKYKAMYEWLDKNDIIGEGLPVPGDIPEGTEGKELEMSRRLNHRFREEAIGDTIQRIKDAVVKLSNERQLQRANRGEIPDRDLKLSLGEQRILGRTVRLSVDMIPGGLADDKTDADFDPQTLDEGQKVEMEHTSDPDMAREIARDHLTEDQDYYKKLRLVEGGTRVLGRVMRFSFDDWGPTPAKVEKIGDINSDQEDVQPSDIHKSKLDRLDNFMQNSGSLHSLPWGDPRLPLGEEHHNMAYNTIHLPEYDPFGHKTESGLYATMDGQGRVAVHMSDDIDEMHRETPTRPYGESESDIRDALDRLHEGAMNSGKIYAETKVYPGFEPFLKAIREAVGDRMKITPQSRDHAPALIASDWLKEHGFDAHGEAIARMMDDSDPINAKHGGFAPSLDYLARDILFHKDPHAQLDRELTIGRPLRYSLSGTKVLGRTIRFAISDFNDIPNAYTIPQDSPPYPIEGEPTFISPPKPPEPSKPGPYVPEAENPPMNLGQEPPTEEDIDQAERRQAGSHQTANHVRRIQTPDGRVYYLKKFLSNNLVEPHAEVAASAILRHLGFDNVPQSHLITTRQGQFTVSPAVRGTPLSHVLGIDIPPFGEEDPQTVPPDEEKARKLREANPPEKVADLLTAQWLINRADAHEANVLVGDNGELHPIDFGQSLHPEVEYHPGWSYNHDAIIGYGLAHPNTPVNKDFIRRILDQEDEITQLAEDKLKDAPPHWREQALETLANKFDQLDRIANYDNPTLADLPEDHTPRLGYNRRGSRIWQPWVHD